VQWWQHGNSSERDFIYVTTQNLSSEQLQALSDEVGTDQSLLVCCAAFHGVTAAKASERWPNLTLKKIPKMVLSRCEWGHDDYSLNVANLPMAQIEKSELVFADQHMQKVIEEQESRTRTGRTVWGERIMNARVLNAVTGRLSLRPPQAESLLKLVRALEAAPDLLGHEQDVPAILSTLKAEFPTLEDFEREFPSLCFALATGVGKTRLMGAFVAYLHLAHGINNFFVLAPNLTIYNKLIADFTRNTPKYVFKGIAEFAKQPPLIITGDNYDQTGAVVQDPTMGFAHDVRINIFNISKINSEVRGGKEPRIKRMKEVLGDSYFNHLANLSRSRAANGRIAPLPRQCRGALYQ
jgi:hypothetical protein